MLARVINRSPGARGFQSLTGTVMIEPGAFAELDLADHDLHRTWEAAGDVAIVRLNEGEPEPRTGRSRGGAKSLLPLREKVARSAG